MICIHVSILCHLGFKAHHIDEMRRRASVTGLFPSESTTFGPECGQYPIPLVGPEWRRDGKNVVEWLAERAGTLCLVGMSGLPSFDGSLTSVDGPVDLPTLRGFVHAHAWDPQTALGHLARHPWAERTDFMYHALLRGGSSDVHGYHEVATDDKEPLGRYPRQYHASDSDAPGRTVSFACGRRDGSHALLIGAPWGSAAERDATYKFLAACACTPNDASTQEQATAEWMR